MPPLVQGLLIGFFGTALYVAVDKYEPDQAVALILKYLVVMWGAAAQSFIAWACSAPDFSN
jgi:hypothetical protein